jgi:type I restriction enzyme M protein
MAETSTTRDIVAKLWNLCHILRDDGVTYNEYVTELTFLLFLKMMAETGREEVLPNGYRWSELTKRIGLDQLDYYKRLLLDLGTKGKATVAAIFADAKTSVRKPTNLKAITDAIDELDWFSAREEGLGNLYEGLLEKNAAEKKSGAGQYFTPRPLIDCIVRLMQPQPGEMIQDPPAGTGGFLVAADRFIKDRTDDLFTLSKEQIYFQKHNAFVGLELVPDGAPSLSDESDAAWQCARARSAVGSCRRPPSGCVNHTPKRPWYWPCRSCPARGTPH